MCNRDFSNLAIHAQSVAIINSEIKRKRARSRSRYICYPARAVSLRSIPESASPSSSPEQIIRARLSRDTSLSRDESVNSRAKVKIWAVRWPLREIQPPRLLIVGACGNGKRPAPAAESRLRPASPYHLGHWVRPGPAKPGKRDPHPLP